MNNNKDELKKEARKLYFKNWRENNKNKIKKHNETFWNKKVTELIRKECDDENAK